MIGAIIGDIVGSRFEFHNHKSKQFTLFTTDNYFSDDTVMTLAVAKALMETNKKEVIGEAYYQLLEKLTIEYIQALGRKYPYAGYGGMFIRWLLSSNPKPYNSFGNGSAMRISPVGFSAKSLEEADKLTEVITKITHNHPEGIKGAKATVTCIYLAKHGYSKEDIRKVINDNFYKLNFTLDEIRDSYQFNETCQGSVPQAIIAFLEGDSFEDAIRNAISIGGDSDTIACITGAISEAYFGVPEDIKNKALSYLDKELLNIYQEWVELINE